MQFENHDNIIVKSDEEYPKIKICRRSISDAKLLCQNFASQTSEMTAVNQYVYEYFKLYNDYYEVAETIEKISVVEMKHLDIIGKMITALGLKPKYQYNNNNKCTAWNGNMIYYGDDIKSLIKFNIMAEEKAIKQYKRHACMIDNGNISEILYRIIKDEELHIKVFNDILCRL